MVKRLVIETETCLKSGQCAFMQPTIFGLEADGSPRILVEKPDGDQIYAVDDAISMCPSQSISLRPLE